MNLVIKKYDELTTDELFEIYKLRISVFVVEQNCAYQDIDDFDKSAIHVFYKENEKIKAYLRVLPPGTVFEKASVGRVIAVDRRIGLGTAIVREGIKAAEEFFGADELIIEAQTYARKLYENLGFVQISDEFLEDGIPHIKMRLDITQMKEG